MGRFHPNLDSRYFDMAMYREASLGRTALLQSTLVGGCLVIVAVAMLADQVQGPLGYAVAAVLLLAPLAALAWLVIRLRRGDFRTKYHAHGSPSLVDVELSRADRVKAAADFDFPTDD